MFSDAVSQRREGSLSPNSVEALAVKLESEPRLGPEEAGKVLGKSKHWVYKKTASGELPSYKNGKSNEYLRSELLEWLAQRARGSRGVK